MKRIATIIASLLIVTFLIFGLAIPKVLESRVPQMERFLQDQGYQKTEMVDISGWQYQVNFKTERGLVRVRAIKGGGFAIIY